MGRLAIPYLGYIEVNLQLPYTRRYNKDVLLLVIFTMTYVKKVLVMVGSNIVSEAIKVVMKGELAEPQ